MNNSQSMWLKRTYTNGPILAAVLLAALLSAVPFFASVIPALTDASSHVLVARILANFDDPIFHFQDFYAIEWQVAPTMLFYVALEQLQHVFGPYGDARAYLASWVACLAISMWFLARSVGNTRPWLAALLAMPISFSWFVWMGFLPYIMTIPLFAVSIAVWVSVTRPFWRVLITWLVLLALFGFHIVGVCAAVAGIVILDLARQFRRNTPHATWAITALGIAPGLLLIAWYLGGADSPGVEIEYRGLLEQVTSLPHYTWASLTKSGRFLLSAWGIAILIATALKLVRQRRIPDLVLVAMILALVGLIVPMDLGALWPAGPRLFPYVMLLLIAALPVSGRLYQPLAVASLALVGALSFVTTLRVIELDRDYREFAALVPEIQPGSRVLPVFADITAGPDMTWPYMALVAYPTVQSGGFSPYVFAKPYIFTGATPLSYRVELGEEARMLFFPGKDASQLSKAMRASEYVLLWRPTPQILSTVPTDWCQLRHSQQASIFAKSGADRSRCAP